MHIILKGTIRGEVNLVAIGYCYSCKTMLHFVLIENAGNTEPGDPYEIKNTDSYDIIYTQHVNLPDFISQFFASLNVIDTHNQSHQDA